MRAFLLFKDHDFDLQQRLPWNASDLEKDLELNTLFNAMALDDKFLFDVARKVVLTSTNNDRDTTFYRQDIMQDCLSNPSIVRAIYDIAVESIESEKKVWWGFFTRHPSTILHRSIDVMKVFLIIFFY